MSIYVASSIQTLVCVLGGGEYPLHLKTLIFPNTKIDLTPCMLELQKCRFPKYARANKQATPTVRHGGLRYTIAVPPRKPKRFGVPLPRPIKYRSVYVLCPSLCFRPQILMSKSPVYG